ncbi:MAG: PliI family lysozyme inhibitor of I-type lysozyme [Arenimonas sp.]|nr:PliI family lysozyme inhibitor of I-type lysozyme [Arenimonas sp.]
MSSRLLLSMLLLSLVACGEKPAEPTSAVNTSELDNAPVEEATVQTAAPTSAPAFNKEFDLQGVHFVVQATNNGSMNTLTITPSGLTEVNDVITREIDGTVTNAEIADINADMSPEIYVWVNSAGSGSYATPIGYSANNKKSLSDIYFPPISDDKVNSKGYMGHDEFAVVEGVIVQRFPIYNEGDSNAQPSGKTRQLQYKLTQGEAGWVMKLDQAMEY